VGTCRRDWCRWTLSTHSCCFHHWGTYKMGRRIPWERNSIGWQEILALCICLWWLCSFGTQSSQGNLISIESNQFKKYATCRYQKYRTWSSSSENESMERDLMLLGTQYQQCMCITHCFNVTKVCNYCLPRRIWSICRLLLGPSNLTEFQFLAEIALSH
jgi:hypothetical protein